MHSFPENFVRTTVELYAEAGSAWLKALPALIDECAQRWSLTMLPPFPLSYQYVAPAVRADGTPVVLKLGFPDGELVSQIPALRLYDGHGMVQLIDADAERGIALLERLVPGATLTPLVETDDEQATAIAAQVMRQLWEGPAGNLPPDHGFQSIADWGDGLRKMRAHFGGGTGPLPAKLVEEAESLFIDLLTSQATPVLLHGDLHHDNIMSATRQPWLALDPKGIVGEPAYEVGALLRNPGHLLELPHPDRITARRVDQLAEALEIDRARIRGWGLAQALLSAWWMIEDHGHGWEQAIACAELLAAIKA